MSADLLSSLKYEENAIVLGGKKEAEIIQTVVEGLPKLPSEISDIPEPSTPLDDHFQFNSDSNPDLIIKNPTEKLKYTQDVSVQLLKLPEEPLPGDILVKQEPDIQEKAKSPLYVRQKPGAPVTPPPVILREKPPILYEPIV